MRCLRRTPKRKLLVRIVISNRRMLLHRQMRVAFIKERVFANQIGLGKSILDLAEFQRNFLVNVCAVAILMNTRLIDHDCFFNR